MNNEMAPLGSEIEQIEKLATYAVESKYFEKLGGYGGIFAIMMYAKELGLPPMQAIFGGMRPVLGKVEIAPQQMNAMIRKAGHRLDIIAQTSEKCTIKGTRRDTGEVCEVTFTIEDAKRAGIYKEGSGWTKYPSDMLFARAISRLGRRLFPDVIGSSYVTDEIVVEKKSDEFEEAEVFNEKPPVEKVTEPVLSVEKVTEPVLSKEILINSLVKKTGLSAPEFKSFLAEKEVFYLKRNQSFYEALKRAVEDPSAMIAAYNRSMSEKKEIEGTVAA